MAEMTDDERMARELHLQLNTGLRRRSRQQPTPSLTRGGSDSGTGHTSKKRSRTKYDDSDDDGVSSGSSTSNASGAGRRSTSGDSDALELAQKKPSTQSGSDGKALLPSASSIKSAHRPGDASKGAPLTTKPRKPGEPADRPPSNALHRVASVVKPKLVPSGLLAATPSATGALKPPPPSLATDAARSGAGDVKPRPPLPPGKAKTHHSEGCKPAHKKVKHAAADGDAAPKLAHKADKDGTPRPRPPGDAGHGPDATALKRKLSKQPSVPAEAPAPKKVNRGDGGVKPLQAGTLKKVAGAGDKGLSRQGEPMAARKLGNTAGVAGKAVKAVGAGKGGSGMGGKPGEGPRKAPAGPSQQAAPVQPKTHKSTASRKDSSGKTGDRDTGQRTTEAEEGLAAAALASIVPRRFEVTGKLPGAAPDKHLDKQRPRSKHGPAVKPEAGDEQEKGLSLAEPVKSESGADNAAVKAESAGKGASIKTAISLADKSAHVGGAGGDRGPSHSGRPHTPAPLLADHLPDQQASLPDVAGLPPGLAPTNLPYKRHSLSGGAQGQRDSGKPVGLLQPLDDDIDSDTFLRARKAASKFVNDLTRDVDMPPGHVKCFYVGQRFGIWLPCDNIKTRQELAVALNTYYAESIKSVGKGDKLHVMFIEGNGCNHIFPPRKQQGAEPDKDWALVSKKAVRAMVNTPVAMSSTH